MEESYFWITIVSFIHKGLVLEWKMDLNDQIFPLTCFEWLETWESVNTL